MIHTLEIDLTSRILYLLGESLSKKSRYLFLSKIEYIPYHENDLPTYESSKIGNENDLFALKILLMIKTTKNS